MIEHRPLWKELDLGEIWRYRELLFFLVWRDVKIRYKQTLLGAAWTLLQPLLTMGVFTLLLGRWAGLQAKTGQIPYSLYVLAGLLPWIFFSNSMTNCANSIVGASHLITKVYFPRIFIPLAAMGSGLFDLGVFLLPLLGIMAYNGFFLSWGSLWAPLFLAACALTTAGVGAVLAALMVSYRDFRFVVPFALQVWMFATPVVYPAELVPEQWRPLLLLNPMAGLVEGFRASMLGTVIPWQQVVWALGLSLTIFVSGVLYFTNVERRFADVL